MNLAANVWPSWIICRTLSKFEPCPKPTGTLSCKCSSFRAFSMFSSNYKLPGIVLAVWSIRSSHLLDCGLGFFISEWTIWGRSPFSSAIQKAACFIRGVFHGWVWSISDSHLDGCSPEKAYEINGVEWSWSTCLVGFNDLCLDLRSYLWI